MSFQTSAIPGYALPGYAIPGDTGGAYARLRTIIPAYLYTQFNDDESLQAFFQVLNALAQGYLDNAGQLLFSLYTQPAISGALLDWVGTYLFGIERPTLGTFSSTTTLSVTNTFAANSRGTLNYSITDSGTYSLVSDDLYKRCLTWFLYLGDGKQMTLTWLRRRAARFLFGLDGGDVTPDQINQVHIISPVIGLIAGYNSTPTNTVQTLGNTYDTSVQRRALTLQVPAGTVAQSFQSLIAQGTLPTPYQFTTTVTIT